MGRWKYASANDHVDRARSNKPGRREVGVDLVSKLTRIAPPTAEMVSRAQLNLAVHATDNHDGPAAREWLHNMLNILGIGKATGVVYVHFGEEGSQVRVFEDPDAELTCQWCRLMTPDFRTRSVEAMQAHLRAHRDAGDSVPAGVEDRIQTPGQPL